MMELELEPGLLDKLKHRCEMDYEQFEGTNWAVPDSKPERHYRFLDNGKKVLAIAHLDFIGPNLSFGSMVHNGKLKAFHGGMDDRSGAFIILDLLPKLMGGMPYDVLLTDDEEHGMSTAGIFVPPPRDYSWMFEFDREGIDCATYDYGSDEWDKVLKRYGWEPVRGTNTDICKLYDLGCRGFNFGNGNHDGHTEWNHVDVEEMMRSASQFVKFFGKFGKQKLPFNEKTDRRPYTTVSNWGKWQPGQYGFHGGSEEGGYAPYNDHKGEVYDALMGRWVKEDKKGKKNGKGDVQTYQDVGGVIYRFNGDGQILFVKDVCDCCAETKELDPDTYLCKDCTSLTGTRPDYEWKGTPEVGAREHSPDDGGAI